MRRMFLAVALIFLCGGVAFISSRYVVRDTEQVLVTQFGRPVEVVTDAGVHFRIPVTQKTIFFPKVAISFETGPHEWVTRDGAAVSAVTTASWRISDLIRFYSRLRDERMARERLEDILAGETRNVVAQRTTDEAFGDETRTTVLDNSRERVVGLGIEILEVDIRSASD